MDAEVIYLFEIFQTLKITLVNTRPILVAKCFNIGEFSGKDHKTYKRFQSSSTVHHSQAQLFTCS